LWGAWDAQSHQAHTLRFVLVDERGEQLSVLTPHLSFGEKEREGLIATSTNLLSTPRLHVRVFDDTQSDSPLLGEFGVAQRDALR